MANQNLGVAVILFTVGLRVVLLPFSILTMVGQRRAEELRQKVKELQRDFKDDKVAIKEEIRKLLKVYKLRPSARVINLLIQLLVLVLLYQVFVKGLNGEAWVHSLYDWVDLPGKLNTNFLGFSIAQKNIYWATGVGVVLFLEIFLQQRVSQPESKSELWYAILFPVLSVFLLSMFPMVKSLFVLTTLAFSAILAIIQKLVFSLSGDDDSAHGGGHGHH
jgi:YidC/Oxa1 family membrane protein insertase